MQMIYRYELPITLGNYDQFYSQVDFKPLHIALYKNALSLWSQVDIDGEDKLIKAYIAGTGIEIPDDVIKHYKYFGTCIYKGIIPLVYHIYLKY